MSDRSFAHNILRFGLGLTFVWAGFMILNDPISWGGFLDSWAQELVPGTIEGFMRIVGIVDIAIGGLIALGFWVRTASLLAAIHLAGILVVSGVDPVTVRDIGLLAAAISLAVWPKGSFSGKEKMSAHKHKEEKEVKNLQ